MVFVASAILYGVACWSSSITVRDRKRLDKIIKRSSSVLGSVHEVGDRRALSKLISIPDHECHSWKTLSLLWSSFSNRLIHPRCVKERFHRSFLPSAVRLNNQQCMLNYLWPLWIIITTFQCELLLLFHILSIYQLDFIVYIPYSILWMLLFTLTVENLLKPLYLSLLLDPCFLYHGEIHSPQKNALLFWIQYMTSNVKTVVYLSPLAQIWSFFWSFQG